MIGLIEKSKGNKLLVDILADVAGCSVFAIGVECFFAPGEIAPGGVSGLSIIIEHLTGFPISFMSFILNIPLLLMAWRFLGREFALRTLRTVAILTATLWLAARFLPTYNGDMMMSALFGGVLEGIGLGLVFMRGSTTGGTDIASRLIQLLFPHMSVGRLMMAVDAVILIASGFAFRNIENALYGLIAIFTATKIIDGMLYGLDTGKLMMIVSDRHTDIAKEIGERLRRGCTILQGTGAYTGADKPVLLCVARKTQYHSIKQIVYGIDTSAFVMTLEANEVIGEGFKAHDVKR